MARPPLAPIAALSAALLIPQALGAQPRISLDASPRVPVHQVENRFIPGFLRRGDDGQAQVETDAALRMQQLEAQVRTLTGQVEELTFAVRQLQAAQGGVPAPLPDGGGATGSGPGAPPAPLGQTGALPAQGAIEPAPATPSQNAALPGVAGQDVASPSAGSQAVPSEGPVDLSALNQRLDLPDASGNAAPPPVENDALATVRDHQQSGRYGLAAQEARAVLNANPAAPVAAEARFLLGEALLAAGDYRSAANYFLENYTSDPNGARGAENLLRLGTALNGLGETEAACSSLEELFGAYPNVDPSVRAAAEQERQAANCT